MRLLVSSIFILFSSLGVYAFDNISAVRKIEFDSFVTYLEKPILRNLDSLHSHLQGFAHNDEERVWLFYGYFAIHTKYDMKRFYKRKNQEYTPGYTCYLGSGVCRDFAHLFKALCIKSNIKCDVVTGEAKIPFLIKLKLFFILKFSKMKGGHAWNVVRYNDNWHLMDVTWARIKEERKNYSYDKKGNKTLISKIQIPDREYYNSIPDNFITNHRPYNPVHTLLEVIPTFKTAFKLPHKQDLYWFDYQLDSILDATFTLPYNTMNDSFIEYSGPYFGSRAGHTVSDHDDWLYRKNAPNDRPSLNELYCYRDSVLSMYDEFGYVGYEESRIGKSLFLRIEMIEKTGSNQRIDGVVSGK
ncbi:MAG: hypothetical protein ACI9N1_000435 [Flavobacteriales bacterium]